MGISEQILNYNYLVQILPYGLMIIDKNSIIINANHRIVQIFGDVQNHHIEKTSIAIYKPDLIEKIKEVFDTGSDKFSLLSPLEKKGKLTFQTVNFYAINNENSETEGVLVAISENNESNLWQREFNLLFENVPVYISIVDKNFKVIRANQRYRSTFGGNYSIFGGDNLLKKKNSSLSSSTALTFQDGYEYTDTLVVNTINKEKVNLIITSLPFSIKDGEVNLVIEISTDITEICKLQDQIHNAHDFYSNLIESSGDGIMAFDIKGKMQFINSAAKNILGFDQQRKPNINKVKEILPGQIFGEPDDMGILCTDLDLSVKNNNDEMVPLRFNSYIIMNKKKVEGRVVFFQDLRKYKKLERRVSDAENKAFQNTINSLRPNIELLLEKHKILYDEANVLFKSKIQSETDNLIWDTIKIELEHLDKLIYGFINSAVIDKSKFREVNINNVLKDVYNNYKIVLDRYKIDFEIKFNDFEFPIVSDDTSIHQLISMLLMNSIESVKEVKPNPRLDVTLRNNQNNVLIEITDNGKPIENQRNLTQLDLKNNDNLQLGLFTVTLIAEKIGAVINTSYDNKRGNTYSIIINK